MATSPSTEPQSSITSTTSMQPTISAISPSSAADAAKTAPLKELLLYYGTNRYELDIFSSPKAADSNPLYHVTFQTPQPVKPCVALHVGTASGPVLGISKHHHVTGTSSSIALGDPSTTENPNDFTWEMLERTDKSRSSYRFEMEVGNGERRAFLWKRTHTFNSSMRTRKLVDEQTGEVVAVYIDYFLKSLKKKKGKIVVWKSWGEEWEVMLLLTICSLLKLYG
ncbi:MAG: hypothetical protein M1835_000885 [Candelina submexicana]|nr:MAG: hypothetical protein M1835_000885 [Candelina submexicana]